MAPAEADEDEVREILQDIDALSSSSRSRSRLDRKSSADGAVSVAWTLASDDELARLEYENSFLQSTETLLESKCASLDSRLEEVTTLLRHRDEVVQEQHSQISAAQQALQNAKHRIRSLESDVQHRNEQVASLKSLLAVHERHSRELKDEEDALEMQIRATSRACEENESLQRELDACRSQLATLPAKAEQTERQTKQLQDTEAKLKAALDRITDLERSLLDTKTKYDHTMQQAREESEKSKIECIRVQEQLKATRLHETDYSALLQRQLEASIEQADQARRRADYAELRVRELEHERDSLRIELHADQGRASSAEESVAKAQHELARLQSEVVLSREEYDRTKARERQSAEQMATELADAKAELETERTCTNELRKQLGKLSRDLHTVISHNRRTAGNAAQEMRFFRETLVECESLISSHVSARGATTLNYPGCVIANNSNTNMRWSSTAPHTPSRNDRTLEASQAIAKSAETLRLRKLRMQAESNAYLSPRARTSLKHVYSSDSDSSSAPFRRSALSSPRRRINGSHPTRQNLNELFATLAP